MVAGLVFALSTAACWTGIAVCYRLASQRQAPLAPFIALGTGLSAACSLGLARWDVVLAGGQPRLAQLALVKSVIGVLGQTGMLLVARAMALGPAAAGWAIGQSAMIAPFVFSAVYWDESPRLTQWLGLALALWALALLSAGRGRGAPTEGGHSCPPGRGHGDAGTRGWGDAATGRYDWRRWALFAASGFAMFAVGETLSLAPAHWPDWSDAARLRVPLYLTSGAAFFAVVSAVRRERLPRRDWSLGAALAVCVVGGQYSLFASIDRLAARGMAGVVFPIAIAGSILGFAVCSFGFLGERPSARDWAGVTLCAAGLAAMASST